MTSEEIRLVVGDPTSISSMAHGQTLLQWQATGCHVALLFSADDRMLKITHQYCNFERAPNGCATTMGVVLVILVGIGMLLSMLH